MNEIVKNMNLTESEMNDVLLELSLSDSKQIIFSLIEKKYEDIKHNFCIINFLKNENVIIQDSSERFVYIKLNSNINFSNIFPENFLKNINPNYLELFCDYYSYQDIPAIFLIEINKILRRTCLAQQILLSSCSLLEKYICICQFPELTNFQIFSIPFYEYSGRNTGTTWYCSIHHERQYIIQEKNPFGTSLQEKDCLALIYLKNNDEKILKMFSLEEIDENISKLFQKSR